jgi:hypothetical protein
MPADWSGGLSTGLQGVAVKGYLQGWVTGVNIPRTACIQCLGVFLLKKDNA